MLVVFGSVAFDTIRTPTKVLKCEMGGAATYASISASFFTKTGLLAVIGKDFPKKYSNVLAKRMNLRGLSIKDGKTFRYDGKYSSVLFRIIICKIHKFGFFIFVWHVCFKIT